MTDQLDLFTYDKPRAEDSIIRCKDCAKYFRNDQSARQCRYSGNDEGFCFMAERKKE